MMKNEMASDKKTCVHKSCLATSTAAQRYKADGYTEQLWILHLCLCLDQTKQIRVCKSIK